MSTLGLDARDDIVVVEEDRAVVGCGRVDPLGLATEPDHPCLEIRFARGATDDARRRLIERLIDDARTTGADRVLVGWDPMDARGLRLLESRGFRPTGRGPYHDVGGGHVAYVHGYQDATGSTLDLSLALQTG